MVSKGTLLSITAGGLLLLTPGQNLSRKAPIPNDPLEMVAGQARALKSTAGRAVVFGLLDRARSNYALRSAGCAYDLKVTFKVNSGGRTEHDGAWEMEEVFDPKQGFRWTAKASDAYEVTRISSNGMLYGEETASYIPLRLHEARAALFDPIPPPGILDRKSIRKSTAVYNGAQLTCILISGSKGAATATSGRRWDETEECIDPETGLLQTHSQVPGRYYSYDYSNAPRLAGQVLPRKVTVTEAGSVVTEISVDSLTELPAADPSLFVPTEEMKARGRPITLAGAQRIFHNMAQGSQSPGAAVRAVCVFGVLTASGQLVEAHSLQPSDPNSEAAVEAAKQMDFSPPTPLVPAPQQRFVFVIQEFVTRR